jgi:hypothetical protein
MDLLYKYRSIENFRFFADIILKQRLYAAPYFDLNDPMEGRYLYNGEQSMNKDVEQILSGKKNKVRIVSLSRNHDNELMWAHYANGHRGVAVGVELDPNRYDVRPILYDGIPAVGTAGWSMMAEDILSHKHEIWRYEEEERVFVTRGEFAEVRVRQVICGSKMSHQDFGFVRELVERINPKIQIHRRQ